MKKIMLYMFVLALIAIGAPPTAVAAQPVFQDNSGAVTIASMNDDVSENALVATDLPTTTNLVPRTHPIVPVTIVTHAIADTDYTVRGAASNDSVGQTGQFSYRLSSMTSTRCPALKSNSPVSAAKKAQLVSCYTPGQHTSAHHDGAAAGVNYGIVIDGVAVQ